MTTFRISKVWPFIVLPLLLLLLVLYFDQPRIETDVANKVKIELEQHGLVWPEVSTYQRGRDVLILGQAPNHQQVKLALDIAAGSEGTKYRYCVDGRSCSVTRH